MTLWQSIFMPIEESEYMTRRNRIDPELKAQGWSIAPFVEGSDPTAWTHHAVTEYPTSNGPADYALFLDGKPVGIVEAKKLSLGPQNVLTQAERYSKGLGETGFDHRGFKAPFLYSTNGEVVWFHDVRPRKACSRRVKTFHTPVALREKLAFDHGMRCAWFQATSNNHHRLRPYQVRVNGEVEQAISDSKHQMMVAMATGTGKTFTLVNQVYRLLRSGVAKRVLFLVDRRALAAQAARAFATFEPMPNQKFTDVYKVYSQRFRQDDFDEDEKFDPTLFPIDYLTNPPDADQFVFICTIQRMAINLFGRSAVWSGEGDDIDDDDEQVINMPIHAFDVIVADECHRGYTSSEQSVWRGTLDHFDAIRIGLTATPAPHTKAYFNEVVSRYDYTTAVQEGFLVDYDPVKLKSNVKLEGIKLQEGETVQYVDPATGNDSLFDQMEEQRDFTPTELERMVTSPDSNRKILQEIKKYADEHEQTFGRYPKMLIFAAHDLPHISHADQLVELAKQVFERGDSFVRKITGRSDRPLKLIRELRNRPMPGIVVSVDLMSTGVDIPDLEYIIFLRPVRSRILFEQMLGRGTRKGDKYPDKSHFVVFDCFDGELLKAFRDQSAMAADAPDKPGRTIQQLIEDIWANKDRDYNIRCLVKRLHRIDKEMGAEARDRFAAFGISDGDMSRYATALPGLLRTDFSKEMRLLRTPAFQDLLVNYLRKPKTFVRAIENQDVVTSEYLVRDGAGKEYKPADYLVLFGQFVKEHADKIDAIRILLDKPRGWNTKALTALRNSLKASPGMFTEEKLRLVHHAHYKKALVDIISMVKHAAKEQEPLLTAAERVDKAIARLSTGLTLTGEQQAWLHRIREHLAANLTIDKEDFEAVPVLADAGGWGRANRVFDDKLEDILSALNEAMAA
jgi:type I restriction enzyme R subunit